MKTSTKAIIGVVIVAAVLGHLAYLKAYEYLGSKDNIMKGGEAWVPEELRNLLEYEGETRGLKVIEFSEALEVIREGKVGVYKINKDTDVNYRILVTEESGIISATAESDVYPVMSAYTRNGMNIFKESKTNSVIIEIHPDIL